MNREDRRNPAAFPLRQIHLDFHTAPNIPNVGADWDAELFVHTLRRAHVSSITLFAKYSNSGFQTGRQRVIG